MQSDALKEIKQYFKSEQCTVNLECFLLLGGEKSRGPGNTGAFFHKAAICQNRGRASLSFQIRNSSALHEDVHCPARSPYLNQYRLCSTWVISYKILHYIALCWPFYAAAQNYQIIPAFLSPANRTATQNQNSLYPDSPQYQMICIQEMQTELDFLTEYHLKSEQECRMSNIEFIHYG